MQSKPSQATLPSRKAGSATQLGGESKRIKMERAKNLAKTSLAKQSSCNKKQ
jgi:hypothetical protein